MTYQGAIDELKSLENNESMPDWFKPTLKKVRETMEMDRGETLDVVKAEILRGHIEADLMYVGRIIEILDNIGKENKSCNTCKNNDDEFSGECYECVKNIQNHYKAESEDKE